MQNKNINLYNRNHQILTPFLLKEEYKGIIELYFEYIFETENIINNPSIHSFAKLEHINHIENVFYKKESADKYQNIIDLRNAFEQEFIAPSIFMDSLSSLRKDAANTKYETWGQLIDYCTNISGTNARFLLSLYEENPSTYNPATSLCVAHKLLRILINTKEDLKLLGRQYIPQDIMNKYKISTRNLSADYSIEAVSQMYFEIFERIKGILKDAEILPAIIKNKGLKIMFCILLSKTHILLRKTRKYDLLYKQPTLSSLDNINIFMTGLLEGIFTGYKSLKPKGKLK